MANDYAPPTYNEVQAALSYIPTPATHNEWYPIAIAIKDALGENGFTLWDEWSRQGKGYNSSIVKSTWKSATPKPGGITAATLFKLARDNGYRPERPYVPPTPEQTAEREAEQRARDEAAARELAETRRQAARKAYGIWKNADTTVDLNHAYLQRKGIAEAGLVRGIRQNEYQGQRQLVIPLYQGGKLVSVQTINEAGGKHFLKGGEKSGSYAVLGSLEREAHKGIVLVEGFATAASIRKATGAPVVIAFDSGNMIRIAENMATRLPEQQRVILAADNDPSGTGLAAASQAAALLGSRARIALPEFDSETVRRFQTAHGTWDEKRNRENLPTDFNDLHLTAGIEAVRAQMAAALPVPERPSENPPPAQEQNMAQQPERPSENGYYAYQTKKDPLTEGYQINFVGGFAGEIKTGSDWHVYGSSIQSAVEKADYIIGLHRTAGNRIGESWPSPEGRAQITHIAALPLKAGQGNLTYAVQYENLKQPEYTDNPDALKHTDTAALERLGNLQAERAQTEAAVSGWLAQTERTDAASERARSVLDTRVHYRGLGTMTRAEFIREHTKAGWEVFTVQDGKERESTGLRSPDGKSSYVITETEKQFADWLVQRQQPESPQPAQEQNMAQQPERPSENPPVRLKEGHIRLETPIAFERTPFGYRTAEMAHTAAFERRHITISGGKIVGAHPGLAQEMGWTTVGEIQPKSERTLQKEAQAAAREAETAKAAQAAVATMRLNETAAQIAPELRQQAQQDIRAALNDPTLDRQERVIAAHETAAAYRDYSRPSENPAPPTADPDWEQTVADQRRLDNERRAERAPWRDFPPVVRNGGLGSLKNEPEYAAAKGGDDIAAGHLVNKLLKEETVRQFRAMIGDRKPVIVSILATESAGQNKIPLAMAQALGRRLDLPVDTNIRQINKVSRTGSGIDHRFAFQPVFDGQVDAGRDYLIVDDTLAVGGTVAALRGYIENRGGHVVGAGVMTAHEGALNLPVKQAMIDGITRKHGYAMDNYWKEEFGYGIDQLTQGEAGHLRSAENVDRIRDRINDARLQGIARPTEQTLPLSPGQQERPDGIASEPAQAAAPSAAAFSMPVQEGNMATTPVIPAAGSGRSGIRRIGAFVREMKAQGRADFSRIEPEAAEAFAQAVLPVLEDRGRGLTGRGSRIADAIAYTRGHPNNAVSNDIFEIQDLLKGDTKWRGDPQTFTDAGLIRPNRISGEGYYRFTGGGHLIAKEILKLARERNRETAARQQAAAGRKAAREAEKQAGRTLLNVPYAERAVAKEHGARWDRKQQSWYLPPGTEIPDALRRFLPAAERQPAPIQAAAPNAAAFSIPAANARQAEQEQNMAQQTQTAQPDRPSENPARITGITLVWSEGSEDKDRRFKDFDELQQWFEKTYRTADFNRQQGYSKNHIEVAYTRDGQEHSLPFRADVSGIKGDFNPQREHIAEHMSGVLEKHGIAAETARRPDRPSENPQPAQEQNPAEQPERPSESQAQTTTTTPKSGRSELREKAAKALDTAGSIMDAAALAAGAATGNFVGAAALVAAGKVAEHAAGKLMEDMEKQAEKADAANRRQEPPSAAAEPENGIEYGGSRTQDAARSEPETITAAEVRESLRRIRAAERRAATPAETVPEAQERPSENERGVPVAANKEAQADTGRPSEKTSAEMQQEKRAQPKPVLDLNYETAAGLDTRYVRYDGRYLDPDNARTVLFEDKGAKIKTAREDAQTVSDMLDTAQAKNWDSIRISGSREFKRQMWLEAELRGIPNSGYSPSKEDLAMRDQMRAARERNSIEAGGINRTAEPSAHNPPPRQPENRQSAHSPSEQLVADDSVRLKSEAANLQTRAETPAQTQAANRAAETAVQAADEQQSVPKPDSGRTADKSQDPSSPNHALEAARAAYLSKADKLSKAAKEQLANHERDFAEAVKGIPESKHESAMLNFYTGMQKRMSGTKLDMPEPTATAERSQTQQPRQPSVQPKRRDDGMDMDR